MYELFILAHLMRRPSHGYLIAKIINDMIGPYAHVSNGRLYPLLARLLQDGLIQLQAQASAEPQKDRQLRSYEITEAGKQRFRELMSDTTINPGEYQKIFLEKSVFLDLVTLEERLYIIDHYINYCQAHITHLIVEKEEVIHESPTWGPSWQGEHAQAVIRVIQHKINQWQMELDWVKDLRKQELARQQQSGEN